jgi:ArsR family transcriptional regulator
VRVTHPDGLLVLVDLAPHDRQELLDRHAHRWPGFDDAALAGWLGAAGCAAAQPQELPGELPIRLWPARRLAGRVAAIPSLAF